MSTDALDQLLKSNPAMYKALMDQVACERSLFHFVRCAWGVMETNPFQDNWHIRNICLPYDAKIMTEYGERPIGAIVHAALPINVLSWNHDRNEAEWKPVVRRMKNGLHPLIDLTLNDGSILSLTGNHPVYVAGRGYVEAGKIKKGDKVLQVSLLREKIYPQGKYKGDVLLSEMSLSAYPNIDAEKKSSPVQKMRQGIRASAIAVCRGLLLSQMLVVFDKKAGNENLSDMREEKSMGRQKELPEMLGEKAEKGVYRSMRPLQNSGLPYRYFMGKGSKQEGDFLQQGMHGGIPNGEKQSGIHRWWARFHLPSKWIPANSRKNIKAGLPQMLSLQNDSCSPAGYSSYGQKQSEQRGLESSLSVPNLSQSSKGDTAGDFTIGESYVVFVKQSVQIPEEVYNIEVEGNNNYFAQGVLVHNCDELERVTRGESRFLLINLPPRCGKTDVVSICWPLWTWIQNEKAFTSGNGVRFLCASYGDKLTLENADKMRDLANSAWFQCIWGDKVKMRQDKSLKSAYGIGSGGTRYSTSIGGTLLGLGGDIIIVDDPHNTESVESDKERESTLRGWRELSSTRLNDPKLSAIVVVMQRLHQNDVSGTIADGKDYDKWEHIMYPMRHDPARHCPSDPRTKDRELMWPERFGEKEVSAIERELGPYMASGRLQQSPSPEGGGIIKVDYWKLWPETGEEFLPSGEPVKKLEYPTMDYVIAAVDTAYSAKTDADFNAIAILGLWRKLAVPKIMLMHCWQKRLDFRGEILPKLPDETDKEYRVRRKMAWGMLEWTAYECARFKVDKLLIEGRATGITLAQEMRKVYGAEKWSTQLIEPKGDKIARVYSVQHLFAEGMIYAPERDWARGCIDEFEVFPKGAHDDRVDAVTMGIRYLRDSGWALRREEVKMEDADRNKYISKSGPLYDV